MYDIFRNPQLKSIMMIYLMMMGFDLFGRYMIPGAGAVAPADGTAPATADGMSATILNEKGEAQSTL
jgi:sugar phosphate permease